MRLQGMDQNSFLQDAIDREAIKIGPIPTIKNCLSSDDITPTT